MTRYRLNNSNGCDERPDAKAIRRFMAMADMNGPEPSNDTPGRCWTWKGHCCRKGYGQFKWRGRAWWAYQIAYLIFNGVLIAGKHRAHRCNNNSCVNPDHIGQIPPSENIAERNRRYANIDHLPV